MEGVWPGGEAGFFRGAAGNCEVQTKRQILMGMARSEGQQGTAKPKTTDSNGDGLKARSARSFPWEFQATANPNVRGDNDGDSRGPVVIPK